ncbi:MAG: 2-oxoglutarate dehydrogenase complex dihydrolipoyllysine-residue succinyltransferase [Betaproteobacteria bacterium]|nr:2-oxoglutarate dehydrogenase complex dihydrolipoyllysine-residue succinyltransferase [Betaproteobacteria bacterium]
MLIEVKVPQLSESVAEATLVSWRKKAGEFVQQNENLIDIETDKVVLELPAPQSGVLASIVKQDGETVVANEIIATIDTEGKTGAVSAATTAAAPAAKAAASNGAKASAGGDTAVKAMPAAAKIAADNNMDLNLVSGSGRGGRITKEDVMARLTQPPAPVAKPAAPKAPTPVYVDAVLGDRPEQRVAMSRLRARVAERLVQSQATAAILTTFNEVNMQPVMDLRARHKDKFEKDHGARLGFMSFFVKAAVHALKRYPVVNASVDGNDIVYHGYFDIGIAVSSPRGLVVPILRNCDQMSLADIEKAIAEFGNRAKDGKLTMEDLTGGTFSISNGGVFGSMLSTPIINPPQSAILGVHATKERAVVENGQIVIRSMNYLALSYDHRIIDGREAVLTLVAIKEALEDPMRLLLEV